MKDYRVPKDSYECYTESGAVGELTSRFELEKIWIVRMTCKFMKCVELSWRERSRNVWGCRLSNNCLYQISQIYIYICIYIYIYIYIYWALQYENDKKIHRHENFQSRYLLNRIKISTRPPIFLKRWKNWKLSCDTSTSTDIFLFCTSFESSCKSIPIHKKLILVWGPLFAKTMHSSDGYVTFYITLFTVTVTREHVLALD